VERTRATSSDWKQHYGRADRMRDCLGDPFRRLIARRARRTQLIGAALALLAVVATATLVWFGVGFLDNVRLDSVG
jgi:hypothetical protein